MDADPQSTEMVAPAREPAAPAPTLPVEPPEPARFAFGPSLAIGMTTPSSGSLFTNVYGLVDLRFVIAWRAVGPLWLRFEPGTTMSWNNTQVRKLDIDDRLTSTEQNTVRVHSVGARAIAAVDLASRRGVIRGGGVLSYGGASLPDSCGGETRGGFAGGGVLGGGFRPDAERRLEIGVEAGVFLYPYGAKCTVRAAQRSFVASLQENPELAFTVGATWFVF